ncbi:hypothetical protein [Streptomyces sp. NPDC049744]|uniref:DUF6907 domain-containing protein n=1 Tax=Streptomyces sp. NPDC049744 TaxID=3154359 RepID=UPI0034226383
MQNTVASLAQQVIEGKPGHRLVPALVGRSGNVQTVWIDCPNWCVLDHTTDRSVFIEDINHEGERRAMSFPSAHGETVLVEVYVSQWPGSEETQPYLAVDVDREVDSYGRTAAMALADQMVAFAADVRRLAQTLPDDSPRPALSQADEALRQVQADARGWQSLTGDDVASLPIARLLKAFGVTVVDADVEVTELHGMPGRMELRVPAVATLQAREADARRLLAHHVGADLNAEANQ